ncbi:hypothetical protein L798_12015 [Zootermopsis nevadensis]|uniref:Uncharacterized protein n=1 Tax=Zootermopsis nevadensis TaxID=136037 RepID=A0A067R3U6_ZOONE|nr:hypothetical protein L798_12015 [Zootermopsis nevadensis]
MCSVAKCTRPAAVPSSKLLVCDSLRGSSSQSSAAKNVATQYRTFPLLCCLDIRGGSKERNPGEENVTCVHWFLASTAQPGINFLLYFPFRITNLTGMESSD